MRYFLVLAFALTFGVKVNAQETPVEKSLKYTLDISGIKTESIADDIESRLKRIEGVDELELEFIEYQLTFTTTNIAMREHEIMSRMKAIMSESGVEIQKINKEEIK